MKVTRQWTTYIFLLTVLSNLLDRGLSQTGVILSSVNVYALKTRATYSCSAEHAIEALWFLNGTDSRELNLTNTTDFFFSTTNVGIFIFQYLTGVYNNTHIQCEALFPSGPPERSGNNKTLVIQGFLSSVDNLNYSLTDNNLTLLWEAPFTLDIPNIDVDIKYCVTIYSSGSVLHSQCDIRNTRYYYHYNSSFFPCVENVAIITPVNIVGNGTTSSTYIDSEEEYICTEDITTVTTAQQNSTSIPNKAFSENLLSTALSSTPKTFTAVVAAVAAFGVVVITTTIILITLFLLKLRDRKRVCKLQSKKNDVINGRCYDVIASGSTEDHIYEEIKGKLNKSSQQFNVESNAAYASHTRIDSNQVPDRLIANVDLATNLSSQTPPTESCSHYETIAGGRHSKGSNSSDFSVAECPAYVAIASKI